MKLPVADWVALDGSRARSKSDTLAVRLGAPTGTLDVLSMKVNRNRFGPQVSSPVPLMRTGTTDGFFEGWPQPAGLPGSGAAAHPAEPAGRVVAAGETVPVAQPASMRSAQARATSGNSRMPESLRGA